MLTGLLVALGAMMPSGSAALTGSTSSSGQKLSTANVPAVTNLNASRPCTLSNPDMMTWDSASGRGSAILKTDPSTGYDVNSIQTGDLIVVWLSEATRTGNTTLLTPLPTPAGWNLIDAPVIATSGTAKIRIAAFWKWAVAGAQSYTFTWTSALDGTVSSMVMRGADPTSPIISSAATGVSGNSATATVDGGSAVPRGNATFVVGGAIPAGANLPNPIGTAPNNPALSVFPDSATVGTSMTVYKLLGKAAGSTVPDITIGLGGTKMWATKSFIVNPAPPDPKVTLTWTSPGAGYSYVTGYGITRTGGTTGNFTASGRATATYVDTNPTGPLALSYDVATQTGTPWTKTATVAAPACPA